MIGAMIKTVENLIGVAVLLAMAGGLKSATLFFANEVIKQQKRGLSSTVDFNYKLMGHKKFCESIAWPDKRCQKPSKKTREQL